MKKVIDQEPLEHILHYFKKISIEKLNMVHAWGTEHTLIRVLGINIDIFMRT